jgi:DNA-binding MarR family transcriptional regulator/N-acetylglutamate synthase-like GNAT family acetyltransferase
MDYIKELKGLALASRMKRIVEALNSDMREIYLVQQINFEPLLMPVMKLLQQKRELTINEIADHLKLSQPAVTQFCSILQRKKYINVKTGQLDKRKRIVSISDQGHKVSQELIPVWNAVESSVNAMLGASKHDLLKGLEDFESEYNSKSLKARVLEKVSEVSFPVKIIDYQERYKESFKKLNYEWIEKDFVVEKSDEFVLSNPKKAILSKGGYIFFAKHQSQIIGTFALIKVDDTCYELAKMAVASAYQNRGVGRKLLDHAIQKAKSLKLKRLILYSNTLLAPAINMYFQYGFKVIPKTDAHNKRANIKMEKVL